jgi:acetyltransferase-like isoleucine patch superfamily enzyme
MKTIISLIAYISSIFFPIELEEKMRNFKDKVYSARLLQLFGSCGINFRCERTIRLWHAHHITIGDNVHVFRSSILAVHKNAATNNLGSIKIGNNVTIGEGSHITAAQQIIIGDNVLMGRRCTITDNSHGESSALDMSIAPSKRNLVSKGAVVIGNNVWLGDNVVVLPGVHIGDGSIIGASSVVTRSTPPIQCA